jgi:NTP pyrophosphatase (non-canonical NTP hydrolase)
MADNHLFTNQIEGVARSVVEFYKRFGLEPDEYDTGRALEEEIDEFGEACGRLYMGYGDVALERRVACALELADVIYTLIGHALNLGIDQETILWAVKTVIKRNDEKTTDTHAVITLPSGVQAIKRHSFVHVGGVED